MLLVSLEKQTAKCYSDAEEPSVIYQCGETRMRLLIHVKAFRFLEP
jgi:hypothetical protein